MQILNRRNIALCQGIIFHASDNRNSYAVLLTRSFFPFFPGIMSLINFSGGRDAALRRPRPAGRNEHGKRSLFRRLTLRSAMVGQRSALSLPIVCQPDNPKLKSF
jgi:hypothetical protein